MGVDTCSIIENCLGASEVHTLAHQLNANFRLSALMCQYDTVLPRNWISQWYKAHHVDTVPFLSVAGTPG
jgi:hypothetical protein